MQVNKHWIYILMVAVGIMASSCSVSRRAVSRYQTLSQRAQVTLQLDQHQYSMSSQVRVWKNQLVVLSIQPMLGIEMVRVEATPDSVWVMDKMNRRYVALAYTDLGASITPKISYKTIQEFASRPISNDKDKAEMEFTSGKHRLKLSCKFTNREYNTLQAPTQTNTNKYKRVTLREILPI